MNWGTFLPQVLLVLLPPLAFWWGQTRARLEARGDAAAVHKQLVKMKQEAYEGGRDDMGTGLGVAARAVRMKLFGGGTEEEKELELLQAPRVSPKRRCPSLPGDGGVTS